MYLLLSKFRAVTTKWTDWVGVGGLWKQSHWPLIHKSVWEERQGSLCSMPGNSGKSPGWEPRATWVRIRTSVLSLAPRVCACSLTDHKMTSCHTVSLAKFSKIMCLKWRPKHLIQRCSTNTRFPLLHAPMQTGNVIKATSFLGDYLIINSPNPQKSLNCFTKVMIQAHFQVTLVALAKRCLNQSWRPRTSPPALTTHIPDPPPLIPR